MKLQMLIEGVSTEALERGLRAAAAVFDKAQLHPYDAAKAVWDIEGWDVGGFKEPGPDNAVFDAAKVWDEASDAALVACGCTENPEGPGLELLISDDQVPRAGAALLGVVAHG